MVQDEESVVLELEIQGCRKEQKRELKLGEEDEGKQRLYRMQSPTSELCLDEGDKEALYNMMRSTESGKFW